MTKMVAPSSVPCSCPGLTGSPNLYDLKPGGGRLPWKVSAFTLLELWGGDRVFALFPGQWGPSSVPPEQLGTETTRFCFWLVTLSSHCSRVSPGR